MHNLDSRRSIFFGKKVKKGVDKQDEMFYNIHILNKTLEGDMTMKTFEVAGVSTLNGKTKVRFANDYVGRFKILVKNGHEDIRLIELGDKLTKAEICKVLLAHKDFQDEASQTAITDFVVRNCKDIAAELETKVEAAETVEAESIEA